MKESESERGNKPKQDTGQESRLDKVDLLSAQRVPGLNKQTVREGGGRVGSGESEQINRGE